MDFKLNFIPKSPTKSFNYRQPMLLTGSCFADNISDLLNQHQFQVLAQPYGVVYNPISIAQQLLALVKGKTYTENDVVFHKLCTGLFLVLE